MTDAPLIAPDLLLGAVIGHYPSDRGRPLILSAIVAGIISVILNFTIAAIDAWWAPPLTVILMALVMLGLAWYLLHIWNREIILFERGFSYREGSQTVFFRYVEIDALRLQAERRAYFGGLIRRTIYRYTLRTTAEETFTITNLYHRVAELGERLTERVNLVLIPRLAAKLERGDSIPFSATLTISAKGLRVDGRDLAWDQFAGWEVKARALHLKQADGSVWASIPLAEIDNITALLNLLRARVQTGVEHND